MMTSNTYWETGVLKIPHFKTLVIRPHLKIWIITVILNFPIHMKNNTSNNNCKIVSQSQIKLYKSFSTGSD